jgi:transposase
MTAPYVLTLTAEQTHELQRVQASHPQAHFRVKATAVLKVAAGDSIEQVRLHGLLKPVNWATLKTWLNRYQQEGIKGWKVKAGRGRKPVFSPSGPHH